MVWMWPRAVKKLYSLKKIRQWGSVSGKVTGTDYSQMKTESIQWDAKPAFMMVGHLVSHNNLPCVFKMAVQAVSFSSPAVFISPPHPQFVFCAF